MPKKDPRKTVADGFMLGDSRRTLTVRYFRRKRRTLTLRTEFGDLLDSVSVDLTNDQAQRLMEMLLGIAGYHLRKKVPTRVSLLGLRAGQGQTRGLEVTVLEGDPGCIVLWVIQQHHGPLDVFVQHFISRHNLERLIKWLAPRLDWELYELDAN